MLVIKDVLEAALSQRQMLGQGWIASLFEGHRTVVRVLSHTSLCSCLPTAPTAFYTLQAAKANQDGFAAIARLSESFERVQNTAEELVVPNAFGSMLQRQAGGVPHAACSSTWQCTAPASRFHREGMLHQAPTVRMLPTPAPAYHLRRSARVIADASSLAHQCRQSPSTTCLVRRLKQSCTVCCVAALAMASRERVSAPASV